MDAKTPARFNVALYLQGLLAEVRTEGSGVVKIIVSH